MNEETEYNKGAKGRLSWMIKILEILVVFAYLIIGFGGIANASKQMNIVGMFESVKTAITFLIIAIVIISILCFVPIFKSKSNVFLAIWNIIWIGLLFYSII